MTGDATNPSPFSSAKALLLNAFSLSTEQRLEKAFGLQLDSSTDKPSQFLARFRLYKREATMDDVEKWALQRSLSEDIRLSLQNNKNIQTADDMAKAADALVQSKSFRSSSVSAAALHQDRSSSNTSQTGPRREFKPNYTLCSLHSKYGSRAFRCTGSLNTRCPMSHLVKSQQGNDKDRQ